ncbi:MAG: PaaI family thioesterase [SAR324 cluster bacterium]|nr:PaaI family thioesterase [SAR324 cluster bacterium]
MVEAITDDSVRLRLGFSDELLRPGGTIAGPVLMSMADTALYLLVLRNLGLGAAKAVTSNLNMSFLRRPPASDLLAHGRLPKLGRRLAVGEVSLVSDGNQDPVSHAMATYALP